MSSKIDVQMFHILEIFSNMIQTADKKYTALERSIYEFVKNSVKILLMKAAKYLLMDISKYIRG